MSERKVVILGSGPAGLIAAHSAALSGADVAIFSRKGRKSLMNGAQYLHAPIPGVTKGDGFDVDYKMWGSPEAYRLKVYGHKWDGTVSPEDLETRHKAWDIRDTYDELWRMYSPYVQDWEASPSTVAQIVRNWRPSLLVSTVPAPALCVLGHPFTSTKVYSTDRSMLPIEENTVICNGLNSPAWYRASRIQGHENTEWSSLVTRPPISPMWDVVKPLATTCECVEKMVRDQEIILDQDITLIRGGRYGKWQKGTLSHEVYQEVQNALV